MRSILFVLALTSSLLIGTCASKTFQSQVGSAQKSQLDAAALTANKGNSNFNATNPKATCVNNVHSIFNGSKNNGIYVRNIHSTFQGNLNNLTYAANVHAKFNGDENIGVYSNNSHLTFQGVGNHIKLTWNIHANFKGNNNTGIYSENTHLYLQGTSNHLRLVQNVHANLKGSNNTGFCANNTHLQIHGGDNTFELVGTLFVTIGGNHNNVTASKGGRARLSLTGNRNIVVVSGAEDSNIQGDKNHLQLKSSRVHLTGSGNSGSLTNNSFVTLNGKNNRVSLSKNDALSITGNNNFVVADNNRGLNIKADKNNISISHTISHRLEMSDTSNRNSIYIMYHKNATLKVSGTAMNESMTVDLTANKNREDLTDATFLFAIDYVHHATINNSMYNLGIFDFQMQVKKKENTVYVKLLNDKVDKVPTIELEKCKSKLTVYGEKKGIKQSLEFIPVDASVRLG